VDRFLWCIISSWLGGPDVENEGTSGLEPDVEYSLTFRLWNLLTLDEFKGSNEPMVDDFPEEDSSYDE